MSVDWTAMSVKRSASASVCACALLVIAVRQASATCDPAMIGKIRAMQPDKKALEAAFDKLPGSYEIPTIFMGEIARKLKGMCLTMDITKEDGKVYIEFGKLGGLTIPLTLQDGRLAYSGQPGQGNEAGNKDVTSLTTSYYIVDYSPEAVSFYTCSDGENDPVLAFTAVRDNQVGKAKAQVEQANNKMNELGIADLVTLPYCKDVKIEPKKKGKKPIGKPKQQRKPT